MPDNLSYPQSDERPAWQETIVLNGSRDDYSTGFTFEVKLINSAGAVALTKTTNIVGSANGIVTVNWIPNDLNLPPGPYTAQLMVIRSSDSDQTTITRPLEIRPRF